MRRRRSHGQPIAAGLAAATLIAASACRAGSDPQTASRGLDVNLPIDAQIVEATVPRHATLESLLLGHQVPRQKVAPLVDAVRDVFDPRRVKADQPYKLTSALDGTFREFEYRIDPDRVLRVAPGDGLEGDEFEAEVVEVGRRIEPAAVAVEITRSAPSLVGALDAAGEDIELGLNLAAILGGEIDFNTELQPGDTIEVLVDRVIRDDDSTGYGDIRAAIMRNGDREISAIRFPDAENRPAYYDLQGRSLKRQFLRSPLAFEPRITSGFSTRRLHPVHGTYRAHLGVDYAAPTGTPVRAVAAGTVEFAAWSGEAGRLVRLRHAGGNQTLYLHLSAFGPGIRPGVRVAQGQVVGRVGMTGSATGPHLDYRIIKNGVYVNPRLEVNRMPKGDPIAPRDLEHFARARDELLGEMRTRLEGRMR
jgi:murein DD-endopeptidase MepM/ murein hydrolase activator NlpD